MAWTEERVRQLKELWAAGLSAGQIAAKMDGVTRNAVIGKVHRLGLAGRDEPAAPIDRIGALCDGDPSGDGLALTVPDLDALNEKGCRWPGEDGFCGAPTATSRSYCDHHHAIAHRETPPINTRLGDYYDPTNQSVRRVKRPSPRDDVAYS